jgi:uncharacterized repeat protein (TIGR03806 family)
MIFTEPPRQRPGSLGRICLSLCVLAISAPADLVNRWSFNQPAGNAPSGTVMIDSVANAEAVIRGQYQTVASFNGSALRLPGTSNGNHSLGFMSAYINLPNGIVSSKTDLSVEIWATPHAVTNYDRLFDFGSSSVTRGIGAAPGEIIDINGQGQTPGSTNGVEFLYMSFGVVANANAQRMDATVAGSGTGGNFDSLLATSMGTRYHYVLTYEDGVGTHAPGGGRVSWYRNGALVHTRDVDFQLSEVNDVNNWLGRSQWTQDWNANASYDEVRIYDHALNSSEIAANLTAGPDSLVVTPVDPPVPDHVWTFTTQANSTAEPGMVFTDEAAGNSQVRLLGNGGHLTGGAVVLPGHTNGNQTEAAISAYLDLPNGIVSASPSVTFEAWATPLSSKTWQRLFDFGRCVETSGPGAAVGEIVDGDIAPGNYSAWDNLSLTLNNGADLNAQQLEGEYDNNGPVYTSTAAATTAGTEYHYVLTVQDGVGEFGSNGCRATWYRNGVFQNSDDFNFRLTDMEDVNNWIGRSMYGGDSNSNLALNELRIYRRAISQGEIVASFSAGPDPSVGPPEPPAPPPVPIRRWDFNTAAGTASSGTVFLDAATGETATVRGNGATTNGSQLVLPGGTNGTQTASAISAYLELPNGFVSARKNLSLEAWVTPLSSKFWQRVFDFGNCTVTHGANALPGEIIDSAAAPAGFQANDNLFLSLNIDNTLGSHRIAGKLNAGAETGINTDLSSVTATNSEYHFVMTVEDKVGAGGINGCRVKWYRDSILRGSVDLAYRLADMEDVNNWIGRSNWSADQNSHMAINELRVYDRAITRQEINASFAAGANVIFPAPIAVEDSVTIHSGQKVLMDVLANDTGGPLVATLEIVTPPSHGTATVNDGSILYAHAGGASSDALTYRVSGVGGVSNTASVTVTIANSLRIPNPALAMPAAPPASSWQIVDALPGLTFNEPLCIASIPGDKRRLFVCERMAKVQQVSDVTASSPSKNVFLDLQSVVAGRNPTEAIEGGGNGEHGLLGLAFHPNYAANGYLYVAYTVRINGGSFYQRISRFSASSGNPNTADPSSELILLQQLDEGSNHDGGDIQFGPDGYLYYAAGDEENSSRGQLNSQKINGDFFGGIFRIDVDRKPGNLEPNPHAAIPTDGGIARFSVPVDNPFVHASLGGTWDGTYHGVSITPLGSVRTEFWATGLRHVWRMSFDRETGDLWAGDVGQNTYEEINRISKGGNYGWAYREGAHDFNGALGSAPVGFSSIDPFYEYVHAGVAGGDVAFKGNSVVGGYVYRGTRFPALLGSYVFSDSVSGHVWRMDTATGAVTRLTGLPGQYGVISSQGVDPSNQDLLFCAYLNGKIMRLTTGSIGDDGFPPTLSATGLFSDLSDLSPAPGLLPVEANLRFWSDYAEKKRWFAIPDGNNRMTWQQEGAWAYPTGMLWVKHFDLALSRGNPATNKRLETRVLVKTDSGAYGVSYRWNDEGTEAHLVEDAGVEFDLQIDDHGMPHTQRWQIPGRSSCLTCHGDKPLSFNTRQLNRIETMNGFTGNQIELLAAGGYIHNTPAPVSTLPRHVRPDETGYPLEQRARSYFDVNCAYCHQDGGSVSGFWDGREHLTLEQTGLIRGHAVSNGGDPLNRYIVPGDTTHSIVLHRMAATNGFGRMPPLGSSETDPENIQLITQWILNELPNRPLYDEWAAGYPGIGGRTDDPDGDGMDNYNEYLRGSSPLTGAGSWQAEIATDGSGPVLHFLRKAHRVYSIETSNDLSQWERWGIPQNHSGYGTTDQPIDIPFTPPPGGKTFFRFRISEP